MEYRNGRHVFTSMRVNLVFVTKCRRGVLDVDAHERLRAAFDKVASDFNARLLECDGEDDHVHLLIEYPPVVAVSKLVNSLKGVGSRLLLRDREDLRRFSRKGFWSPSYFAASCGGAPIKTIKSYVRNQRTPTK
ncbi:IS200/IS605 family transposase [Thioclava sp. DLFJ5-1]|uniref:IS200/IS605 family transposase n=1 Tax=Thioclava sp. DLFJ5-1 TaxID=1915314 RepID=UPI000997677C|nr:IS200/IS605 family transposase [Thioclava sp. DLFJ5-1]OOY22043.1 IS200/IS605 family transposase [Thioclava sp. DLFJ5-1]